MKRQGTIIGSNLALPAKQVCGLYFTIANPALCRPSSPAV
jgi:hypothetical protein